MTVELPNRSRRILFGSLALLLVAAAATLPLLPRDNSIDNMLPRDSNLLQMLGFLQEARFAGQVAISFERTDNITDAEFIDAVDRTVEQLDSPLIEQIIHRMGMKSAGSDIVFFQQQVPALTGPEELFAIEEKLTPPGIDQTLHDAYLSLIRPGGSVALPLLQRDPFGIEQQFLSGLQALAASSGYSIELKHGHLFSRDGRHMLTVLETSAPVTDVSASRELLNAVDSALAGLPPGISTDVVCGHRHSVSNEQILKRDVQRAVLAASIGFILLFALCFRDPRAQFIFAIPLASVLFSIHLCRWIAGPLSLLVLGFGVVIVGIAVDYGIHIYVALRRTDDRRQAWKLVVRPIVLGALTTLGVFIAFFTAGVPGYTQMAVFSIISIILSLLGALFVLPPLIKTNPPRRSDTPSGEGISCKPLFGGVAIGRGGLFLLWVLLLVALLFPFPKLSFDGDLKALDGSGRDVLQAEERFRSIWGEGAEAQGMVVLEADDYQSALQRNDALYEIILSQGSAEEFSSFSRVWKSEQSRTENAARWQEFWGPRLKTLEKQFAEQGARYGFKPDAFRPFFQGLEKPAVVADEPDGNQIFENLKSRFRQSLNGKHQLISFFPDTEEWVRRVREALDGHALLISRRELNRALSEGTVAIVRRVAAAAVALVILFTLLLMRRPKEVLLALLPSAVSIIAVLKIMNGSGLPVNIPTLIAGIVVIGLTIDYGVFMVFACRRNNLADVGSAVTLSTVTTLIGAGVLLLTRHPALFSIGVTMAAGLLAGYATAMCAVPFLFSRHWKTTSAVLLLLLTGCAALQPCVPVELTQAPQPEKPFPPRFRAIQSVVFSFYGRTMTGIGALALDREKRSFELSCMTPMGSKLFDLRYADETPEVLFALPFFTEKKGFAEAVATDIARVYFDPVPPVISGACRKGDALIIESRAGDSMIEYRYEGVPPVLREKIFRRGRAVTAEITYSDYFNQDGFFCIAEAELKSRQYGYRLTIRTKNLKTGTQE